MAMKLAAMLSMLGAARHLIERAPDLAGTLAPAGGATGAVTAAAGLAGASTLLLPLAVVGPALVETAAKRVEGRAEPHALINLFRESMLEALRNCAGVLLKDADLPRKDRDASSLRVERLDVAGASPPRSRGQAEDDKALIELWLDAFSWSLASSPFWQAVLEDTVPDATVRTLAVDPRDASSWWPTLRVLLTRWTNVIRNEAGGTSLGLSVPDRELGLSRWAEEYLRANLPREFFRLFTSRLTSGNQQDAFRQASLSIAADLQSGISALRALCAHPEPLKAIGEFPSVASIKRDIQILNAQYRAFPYIGRGEEIDKLVAWLNGPEPASFFVIAGGAGDGKTRLGFQLLEILQGTQSDVWRAGWLATRRAGEALRNERFRKWRGTQPTLIVIDYAASMSEALRDNVVRELAEEPAESRSDLPPLRILLLEREADEMRGWYDTLIRAAGDRAPELFPHSVLRLSKLDDTQRRDLFGAVLAAARALDTRLGAPAHPDMELPPPARFAGPKLKQPLAVCMAAIVAHRRSNLTSLELGRLDLAREVANHEYGRIEIVARKAGRTPFLLLHLAAYTTLSGSLTESQLRFACRTEREAAEPGSPWTVPELESAITGEALPPSDRSAAAEPVQPDIVGEAFLVKVLRHDPGHAPAETILRAAAVHTRPVVRTLIRVIQDLSAAANEPTTAGRDAGASRDWALSMLTALLGQKARSITNEDYAEVRAALRHADNSTALSEPCRDFFRAIRSNSTVDPVVAMDALRNECMSAYMLGESEYAVKGLTTVADAARGRLVTGGDVSDFVWTLIILSYAHHDLRHGTEALAVATEAADLLRVRRSESDDQHDADISAALIILSQAQTSLKQPNEALASSSEALEVRRRLRSRDSDRFSFLLAEALASQAQCLRRASRSEEALAAITEALGIQKELANDNPDSFLPNFAAWLHMRARIEEDLGKSREALTSVSDALRILERLINEQSGGHRLPFLKIAEEARDFEAGLHRVLGDLPAALESIKKATAYSREAVALDETTHLRDLAGSLHNEFVIYRDMGDRANGMKAVAEAVEYFRTLERRKSGQYLPELVNALTNLAKCQSDLGSLQDALNSAAEACQWCNSQDRDDMLHYRATAFSSLGACLHHAGMNDEALRATAEAIDCRQRPEMPQTDDNTAALGSELMNCAVILLRLGRRKEALHCADQACGTLLKLMKRDPAKYLAEFANSAALLGQVALEEGDAENAKVALGEALKHISFLRTVPPWVYLTAKLYRTACQQAGSEPSEELSSFLKWIDSTDS
jgi:tetratricopeptide (TPR) repeat protein